MRQEILEDLQSSGLEPDDIRAREATPAELAATKTTTPGGFAGYVIPYFTLAGKPLPYYRLKLLGEAALFAGIKYKQLPGTPNHVYFPPGLQKCISEMHKAHMRGELTSERPFIVLTEGEKKAGCAIKMGIPCAALGGVYNWRNRIIQLPDTTEFTKNANTGVLNAKVGKEADVVGMDESGPIAVGLKELIAFCSAYNWDLIIVFDTDDGAKVKPDVQRAMARLGYELRHRGLTTERIRQLILPNRTTKKMGLDDYLISEGRRSFIAQVIRIQRQDIAFPKHPNPKEYINNQLQGRLNRKEAQNTALAVLTELESRGKRIRTQGSGELNFFDQKTHKLMRVSLMNNREALHETNFGAFLYKEFGISGSDNKVVSWLASQYTGEPTVREAKTSKVLAHPKGMRDSIAVQLSDSEYAIIGPDPDEPIKLCYNGEHGVLFEQEQVIPVRAHDLEAKFYECLDQKPEMMWLDVMSQFNFKGPDSLDIEGGRPQANAEESRLLAALLFYISPWLHRWRGTQLPVELIIGEAGSGKSTLCGMRQQVITGKNSLANLTNDIRDWYAAVSSQGGIHVLDNVHFTGSAKDYRQRLSDEICRIITEPDPHIEMRKLYTTNQVVSLPVNCTFVITGIEQPFFNEDLIQRSAIFEMQALRSSHDASWTTRMMDLCGGRTGWLAHQLAILHRFLYVAVRDGRWTDSHKAGHRLANYEQALQVMASVFDLDIDWIPKALALTTSATLSETDWVIQGLKEFADKIRAEYPDTYKGKRYTTQDITQWAQAHENHYKNGILTNAWRLGRYMQSHKMAILGAAGMDEGGKKNNRMTYVVRPSELTKGTP